MSWISVRTGNGVWKIKPRWQMRSAERNHRVRVIDLGLFLIVWWSNEDIKRYG